MKTKTWYTNVRPDSRQGLIICETTGRNIAVSYDPKDAPLIASAPKLLAAVRSLLPYAQKLREAGGAIDGLIESGINADYDIDLAQHAIDEAEESA